MNVKAVAVAAILLLLAKQHCVSSQWSGLLRQLLIDNMHSQVDSAEECTADCRDRSNGCMMYKSMCRMGMMSMFAHMSCPLTCGLCKPCVERRSGCTFEPCFDKHRLCPTYRARNMCYMKRVQELCPKLCKICAKPCELPPPPLCVNDCENESKWCKQWVANDDTLCTDDSKYPDLKQVCRLACKLCEPCTKNATSTSSSSTVKIATASGLFDPIAIVP